VYEIDVVIQQATNKIDVVIQFLANQKPIEVSMTKPGPQGEIGLTGEAGPIGETGETGLTGEQGIQGTQGIQGLQGEIGDTGLTGLTGTDGYTPVKGTDYFDGEQGEQGPQGIQGETGIQGTQGIQGETGSDATVTDANVKEALGITTLTGSNTGDQDLTGKANITDYSVTLPSASWTGSAAPYIKEVSVSGIVSTDTPIADIVATGTYATDIAQQTDWGKIYRFVTSTDAITFYATAVPIADIALFVRVVK